MNGLVLGGTYALLGIGLTLIFGLMNLVNFAHGEFYTLGAYTTFAALALGGANFFLAVAAAIVVGAVAGAIVEAVKIAGKDEPKAIQEALWKVSFTGVNGPIKFDKDGPAGKESGQSKPSIFIVQIKDGKVALPDFLAKK